MGSSDSAALAAAIVKSGKVTPLNVKRLRQAIYADGIVSRAEADDLFHISDGATEACREWHALLVEAVTDYIVHQEKPSGYVSEENARWLVDRIARDGTVQSMPEVELLVTTLEKAKSSPPSLSAFALKQVADAVIEGKGPIAQVKGRIPNVIDRGEVELIRRILHAFGGNGNIAVTREEAELLFRLNDLTVEEMNDPTWNELFVKAMANHILGCSGYEAPTREEALRRDAFFDKADADFGSFFSRMVSGGLSAVFDAYSEPGSAESAWETRNRVKEAARRRAEAIDQDEAEWLAERMMGDRLLHENERALLTLIKAGTAEVPPVLKALLDRVS